MTPRRGTGFVQCLECSGWGTIYLDREAIDTRTGDVVDEEADGADEVIAELYRLNVLDYIPTDEVICDVCDGFGVVPVAAERRSTPPYLRGC